MVTLEFPTRFWGQLKYEFGMKSKGWWIVHVALIQDQDELHIILGGVPNLFAFAVIANCVGFCCYHPFGLTIVPFASAVFVKGMRRGVIASF